MSDQKYWLMMMSITWVGFNVGETQRQKILFHVGWLVAFAGEIVAFLKVILP